MKIISALGAKVKNTDTRVSGLERKLSEDTAAISNLDAKVGMESTKRALLERRTSTIETALKMKKKLPIFIRMGIAQPTSYSREVHVSGLKTLQKCLDWCIARRRNSGGNHWEV